VPLAVLRRPYHAALYICRQRAAREEAAQDN
jgi:hypothetical protein